MKKEIEIKKYERNDGIQLIWQKDFTIDVKNMENEVIITANSAGLYSLASHLLTLAQEEVSIGEHIHYDKYNSLEDDSLGLIIQKIK